MALVLRIKFPLSYPVIYKTLRIDSSFTVRQAITNVNETLRVNVPVETIGLYLPHEKRWLDDNQVLSTVPELQEAEEIEFRDRTAPPEEPPKKNNVEEEDDSGCCTIQ